MVQSPKDSTTSMLTSSRQKWVCLCASVFACLVFLTDCLSACRLHLHLSPDSSFLMQHKPYNGGKQLGWVDVISEPLPLLTPLSLIIPAPQAQPPLSGFSEIHTFFFFTAPNGCGNNNGGCSVICIPLPGNSSKCACPDGQSLSFDRTTCVDGNDYLFQLCDHVKTWGEMVEIDINFF